MDYNTGNIVDKLVKQLSLAQTKPGQDQNEDRIFEIMLNGI